MGHTLNDAKKVLDLLYTERKKVKDFILNPSESRPTSHPFVNYSWGFSLDLILADIIKKISFCEELIELMGMGAKGYLENGQRVLFLLNELSGEFSRKDPQKPNYIDSKSADPDVHPNIEKWEVSRDDDFPLN